MDAYSFLRYLHSGFRYIVLLLLVVAIIRAWADWVGKKPYNEGNRKLNMFAMISLHTQLLIGLIVYFVGKWYENFSTMSSLSKEVRYWTVEHWSMMIIAIALVTIGHSRSKKATLPEGKHKAIAIFYTLGLVIIVVAIILSGRSLVGMTH
ncbi:MAG TPA: cytochrome B [Mucilaginibacter sp.]|nr:cytochrome B [Mucilaginibacter sp.]